MAKLTQEMEKIIQETENYKITILGLKRNHKKQLEQRFKVEVSDKEVHRISVEVLKRKREELRVAREHAKQTVRRKRAHKRFLITDYAIGRMVFFKDDMKTAMQKAKEFYKK